MQFKDLTTTQKTKAAMLLKTRYPVLNGENDTTYLTRIAQELLYQESLKLYKLDQEFTRVIKIDFS